MRETSAGGLVISDLDLPVDQLSAALIGRVDRRGRTMWSLPKGHIETGETAEQTAIREVEEETGIKGRALVTLGVIDYWFSIPGFRIHKMVHHYLLEAVGGEISIEGDPDHEAIDARWFRLDRAHEHLTFPNERRIAQMAWRRLCGA